MTCRTQIDRAALEELSLRDTFLKAVAARRRKLRSLARIYRRSSRDMANIRDWLPVCDKPLVDDALRRPFDANATKAICKALYRRRAYFRANPRTPLYNPALTALQEYFACECWTYRQQRAAERINKGPSGLFDVITGQMAAK